MMRHCQSDLSRTSQEKRGMWNTPALNVMNYKYRSGEAACHETPSGREAEISWVESSG